MDYDALISQVKEELRRRKITGETRKLVLAVVKAALTPASETNDAPQRPRIDNQPFYDWKDGIGPVTFFKTHYSGNPPFADELHRYDPALYRALATRCSRNKAENKTPAALSELMPLRPGARGGSIAAYGEMTPEKALSILEERKAVQRELSRKRRASGQT